MLFLLWDTTPALASPSSSPDDDPLYDFIPLPAPGDVLLSDGSISGGVSGDGAAVVTEDENGYTVDYGITNVMRGTAPAPNDVYSSAAVITNDTGEILVTDTFEALSWIFITHNAPYNTYNYYRQVMDEWLIFQFSVSDPEGTLREICPYSTVTDFADNAGYAFPDEANSHIYPPESLDGPYYAKTPIPISEPITLGPGESLRVSWNFGLAWEATYGTENMDTDFNFRLRFNRAASEPTPEPTPVPPPEPAPVPTPRPPTHAAYVVGYPEGDFRPEDFMTRAEAAAIFARLLADRNGDAIRGPYAFPDIDEDAWYAEYVAYLKSCGIITGYPNGSFGAENAITRAEFTAMSVRFHESYAGKALSQTGSRLLKDVRDGHWAAADIEAAIANSWILGYPDGTFRAEADITRAEAVTVVNRVIDRPADKDFIDQNSSSLVRFTDLSSAHWAYYDIMEAAVTHALHTLSIV
jgi:hypothetical protein